MEGPLPLPDREWDFREVPEGRVYEALIWEYSRTQSWISAAVRAANPALCEPPRKLDISESEAPIVARRSALASEVRQAWRDPWFTAIPDEYGRFPNHDH